MTTNIPKNALVLVADGRKALLLRNEGSGTEVSLREERRLSPQSRLGEGPSGSRPEEQTPRQTDEATFAKQLTQTLHAMLQEREFDALVLVADPQTLGQLRGAMHKEVEKSLVRTLDKDLTNHTIAEIARALR